jgi:deoxyribonuclease V
MPSPGEQPLLDLEIPDLAGDLRALLSQIPRGRVTTYGKLAEALGNRIAARWVAMFLQEHRSDPGIPWHRVLRAGGPQHPGRLPACGGSRDDFQEKAWRLRAEGIEIDQHGIDAARFAFDTFVGGRPLERLRHVQEELAGKVSLQGPRRLPRLVGGVDVSYPDRRTAVAAYVLVEMPGGRLVWSTTVGQPVRFPYVTSYLTFREMPILLAVWDKARAEGKLPDVLLVDGSGILHPRHAGLASHFGVVADAPTIGVTKKLLWGQVELAGLEPRQSRPVLDGKRLIGAAIRPTDGSRRAIFVSPGHRVSVTYARNVVARLLLGRRLPEPLYWADRLSRAAGRASGKE